MKEGDILSGITEVSGIDISIGDLTIFVIKAYLFSRPRAFWVLIESKPGSKPLICRVFGRKTGVHFSGKHFRRAG